MKFISSAVLVAYLVVAAYAKPPEELIAKMDEFKADCVKESGVDAKLADEFEKMNKDLIAEKKIPTPEQIKQFDAKEVKCFSKCMAIKFGMFNEKGEFQNDNIAKMFDLPADSDGMKEITQCADANKQEPDLCERIVNMKKCLMKIVMEKRA